MAAVQPETKIAVGILLAGKYKVTRELGRGGMAAVYEAENISIGKRVAVKVLAAELSNSAIVIERFFREARAAASVKSPYIVEVYDSGRLEDGRPFIAMELLEGESLYDRMARVRLIDTATTTRIISQVARGLMKAHAANIVHRDLKPENIHLCKGEDGEEIAKILDFGLAKFYSPVKTDEKTARLTREGAVFGTPAYMSPEQVKGQGSVDHRADLWALGCMTYECLTGRPVWNTDQGVAMTFAAIAAAQLPVPSKMRPDLPPAFDVWFKKALDRDVNKRFQTAKELADDLARALGAPPISLVNIGSSPSQIEMEALAQSVESIAELQERQGPASSRGGVRKQTPGVGIQPGVFPDKTTSEPIDLLRGPQLSATDMPPTAAPEGPPPSTARAGRSLLRVGVSAAVLAGVAAAGWFVYARVLHHAAPAPAISVSAVEAPSAAPSASDSAAPATPPPEMPKWMSTIEDGQQLLASGDADGAQRKFKEASDAGGGAIAKSFMDQVKVGAATTGPCKMTAFSHPRLGYGGNVGRPAVAVTSKGAVVAWTDDHESSGHDHVYSVLLDASGRPTSRARDLTPEADFALRPELLTVDDRVLLLFWDKGGREPGIHVRWLDADGRIGGMSSVVAAAKPGLFWPAIDRSDDGTYWLVWQQNPDKEGDDIFIRHLDADLKALGPEIRATDYEAADKGKSPKVSAPGIAVSDTNVFVAYALEQDKQHLVERMRVALNSPDLASGLQGSAKTSRQIGEVTASNEDHVGGDFPQIECVKGACFLVWHEIEKGAQAALIDPDKGTMLWRKRFAPRGGHPAVSSTPDGLGEIAYYESGKVRIASVTRDGVGTTSTFARVTGDQPRPWIAPGKARGEWFVTWLDIEAGHTEAFVSRLQCRN
ncbi:MAG TPA: serine/threonine-protein kinase [Polyangiaceae bacterium]|nr:serine/threonine-protein kinase [Polyangiaceae bacterium]